MGRRLALLEAWWEFERLPGHESTPRAMLMGEFLAHWHHTHPDDRSLSCKTLYRYEDAHRQLGAPGLLPRYSLGPRDQDVPQEIGDLVGRYYLDRNQRKLTVCYEIARVECRRLFPHLVEAFPSLRTIRRYVRRRWPQQAILLARRGDAALRRHALPAIETDFESYRVMQLWVSDHAQMDFDCVNLQGQRIRPWVTDWREFRSRKRVGWLVHEGPSDSTILAAFAMAVRRHGPPEEVKFDNGRDYSGRTFAGESRRWRVRFDQPRVTALLEHLHCAVHFTIPRNPQGKASQERHYGIDREWFDKAWESYCGKDPASRPDHLRYLRKRPDRLPSLAEVQHLYTLYAQGENARPHTGQGMDGRSPDEVFAASITEPTRIPADELAILLMKPSRPVTVTKDGVWIFDRFYWSEPIAHHFGEKVYVRYDLDRIGRIYVFSLQDEYLGPAERVDLLRSGATEADARRAQARQHFVRRIAKQAQDVRHEVAASGGDLIRSIADDRTQRQAARGRIPTGPDGNGGARKAVRMLHTPFRAAAKAIAVQEAHDQKMAALEAEVAPKIRQMVGSLGGEPAPEEDEGGKILRRFYQHTKRQEKAS